MRRFQQTLCALAMLFIPLVSAAGADAPRPNIIVILCDDLGYSDVGFNGSTDIRTPALDGLAKAGVICTSGYVPHPFCGPSRMGLFTGRYPHTFGAPFNLPNRGLGIDEYNRRGVPVDETLISTVLHDAGYYTGALGKWHMGIDRPYHPNTRGFDEFYGFLGGGHMYFPEKYRGVYERQTRAKKENINEYVLPLEHNGVAVDETEYLTDGLSREAVRFVRQAAEKDQPFFLYVAYNAPHTPLEAKEEDLRLYADITDKKRQAYAAMVHAVDRGVERLLAALKETGELNDTLIVFFSDNGGEMSAGATNRPLREGKGSTYEGGYRVPMFLHWPGQIPAGTTYDYPVTSLDFYPTFAALAGAAIPSQKALDGVDIWDALRAGKDPRPDKMIYALRHRDGYSDVGARRNEWKISRVGQGPWKLFDVANDPSETHDLRGMHPQRVAEMVAETERWSRLHTEPRWFHELNARDIWKATGMPKFAATFRLDDGKAASDSAPATVKRRKGDSTKAEFLDAQRIKYEETGWPFDRVKIEQQFNDIDANQDGLASGQEKTAYWASAKMPRKQPSQGQADATSGTIGRKKSQAVSAPLTKDDVDPTTPADVRPYAGTDVRGYTIAFSDEFNGKQIDESKWYYRTGAKLWSAQLPENNVVADGVYRIQLKKESAQGKEYTGGGIISKKLVRYGYYEAKMKVSAGQGWHTSFWMMRDVEVQDVPTGQAHIELDVVENNSSDPHHFQTDAHRWLPAPHRKFGTKQVIVASSLTDWHVYGLEFTPDELRYFFDGRLIRVADASRFPHNDVNIWATCLAGKLGKKTTEVDEAKLPAHAQFDYVRFFRRSADDQPTVPGKVPGVTVLQHGVDDYRMLTAYVRGNLPALNGGDDDELFVGKWQGKPQRGLLSFPLDGIDASATIEKAELTIWNIDGSGKVAAIQLRQLDADFVEGTGDGFDKESGAGTGVTWKTRDGKLPWKTAGGDYAPTVLSEIAGFDPDLVEAHTFPSTDAFVAASQHALNSGQSLNLIVMSDEMERGSNALARFASNKSIVSCRPMLKLTIKNR